MHPKYSPRGFYLTKNFEISNSGGEYSVSFIGPRISGHLNAPKISAAFTQCQSHRYLYPQATGGDCKAPLIVLFPRISATPLIDFCHSGYRFAIFRPNSAPCHHFPGSPGSQQYFHFGADCRLYCNESETSKLGVFYVDFMTHCLICSLFAGGPFQTSQGF